jgi:hypothetical protein
MSKTDLQKLVKLILLRDFEAEIGNFLQNLLENHENMTFCSFEAVFELKCDIISWQKSHKSISFLETFYLPCLIANNLPNQFKFVTLSRLNFYEVTLTSITRSIAIPD